MHPRTAATFAAALARCPEAVCRRYLPHGRRQGRYWVAGNLHGARGRSLYVRLRPPGPPGKWTDAATGEHGDLLDLIGHRIGAATLGPALDEARAFLALAVGVRSVPEAARTDPPASWDGAAAARRLWRRCRPLEGTQADAFVPPPGTARLLIAADRDAAGRRAAAGLEARAMAQGLAAVVLTPAHGDFNDDLAALGPRALAARLAPLLRPGTGP